MGDFSRELIAGLLVAHLGSRARGVRIERVRTGKFNSTFFARNRNIDVVVRIAPPDDAGFLFYERNMMAQEPEVHRLVAKQTDIPVARILAFDDSRRLIDRDYLIMERLPGVPLTEAVGDVNAVFNQVGTMLAQLHRITTERYGYLGAHHPMEAQDTWVDAFEVMWGKLIDDIVSAGFYDDEEADWARQALSRYRSCFEREVPSGLLHMDIWHQNILVDRDMRVTGIVDWDRALWGDVEIEFAVLDYCGVSVPAFWRGYGQQRDDSPEARIRNVFYLLYEIQKYIVIRSLRSKDRHSAAGYKQHAQRMLRSLVDGMPPSGRI